MNNHDTSQVIALAEVLQRLQVQYWIDSGVLLGLVREGTLLKEEKDIDLGILSQDTYKILQAKQIFSSLGYRVTVNTYLGTIYAIGLNPDSTQENLRAAIHVYYPVGDYLWSPQTQLYTPPPAPDVLSKQRSWAGRLLRSFVERIYYAKTKTKQEGRSQSRGLHRQGLIYKISRKLYNRLDQGTLAETWPIREIYIPLTWVVPQRLVLPLKAMKFKGSELSVPCLVNDYLEYRYGNWRKSVKNWHYWQDDGAILKRRPQEVLQDLKGISRPS